MTALLPGTALPGPAAGPAEGLPEGITPYEIIHVRDPEAAIAALAVRGFDVPARAGLAPVPFRLPFDWHADPLRDRNWMFSLQAWRMLDPYLNRLARDPGHPGAFADPLAVIADWERGNRRAGRFTWYDMSTGLRALKLAFLARMAAREGVALPPLVADLADRHMAELLRPAGLSAGNHGLFQMGGLRALAWAFPDRPLAPAAAAFALAEGARLLDSQLGPVGVHTEDAPDYHFFAVALVGRFLAAPWWQVPEMAPFRARLAAAEDARAWLVDPAGRCLPVGDSTEGAKPRDPAALARWPHRRSGRMVGAVLDGYGVVRTRAEVAPPQSTLVFLMASHHLEPHKHADCLSLLWQDRGAWILVDSGKYGYQRDRMRRHFQSTRAHNTVERAGRDWSRATADAYGSGMRRVEPCGAGWLLEAEVPHRSEGVVHHRLVLFRPHRFVLVLDRVAPSGPTALRTGLRTGLLARRHVAWWHFDPGLAVDISGDVAGQGAAVVTGLPGGRRVAVSHVTGGTGARALLVRGRGGLVPQGWISRAYGAFEPAPALGFASRARGPWEGATLLELVEPGAAPALTLARLPEGRVVLGGAGDLDTPARRSADLAPDALPLDIAPGLL